jgi:hypothetical protein
MVSIDAWEMCANLEDFALFQVIQMTDEKRLPALCLALVDPLPADMTAVAEWYMTQVQRLDSIVSRKRQLSAAWYSA